MHAPRAQARIPLARRRPDEREVNVYTRACLEHGGVCDKCSRCACVCVQHACTGPRRGAGAVVRAIACSGRRGSQDPSALVRAEAVKVHGLKTAQGVAPAALGCAPFRPVARLADKALCTKAGAFLLLFSSLVSQAALLVASQTR
eukprot:scaffold92721_cov63-Phaeocystis_antarctica.AAC.1